jgi:hypothetical protein
MRKILSSVLVLCSGMILLHSCTKVDIPQDVNSLSFGSYVTLKSTKNLIVDYSNLATSKVAIDVAQYGADQEKITIYVSAGTPSLDRSTWKKIKEVPNDNNGLYSLSVSGSEIATAIAPAVISPGNVYTLYNVITTKDGRTFDFVNTASTFSGNPNYNMALTWAATVVCPFIPPIAGKYKVIQDDWQDWQPGDLVDVTDGPLANQVNISKVWPNPAAGSVITPLAINVDPATGQASIPSGVIWANYGSYNASTLSPNTGYVFACTYQIIMNIRISASGFGDQGSFKLILKK